MPKPATFRYRGKAVKMVCADFNAGSENVGPDLRWYVSVYVTGERLALPVSEFPTVDDAANEVMRWIDRGTPRGVWSA